MNHHRDVYFSQLKMFSETYFSYSLAVITYSLLVAKAFRFPVQKGLIPSTSPISSQYGVVQYILVVVGFPPFEHSGQLHTALFL